MIRHLEVAVISDLHLGSYGSQAEELLNYLSEIRPEILVLNGDIIDIWQFKKNFFPKSHLQVIKKILDFAIKGTRVVYITGNHDEFLRKFADHKIGNIEIVNKLLLKLNDKKVWMFHGDIFDLSIQQSKWLAKLGSWAYDLLIYANHKSNKVLNFFGKENYSFSKKIKNSVKKAVSYIQDFEEVSAELAIEKGYDYVICGHIHQPQIREIKNEKGKTTYMNSGDWIESLTALEYNDGEWELMDYSLKNGAEKLYKKQDILDMNMNLSLENLILNISKLD